MPIDADLLYKELKEAPTSYYEPICCPMILEIMCDPSLGTYSAFCVKARISESTFWKWLKDFPFFALCYSLGKMHARENWETLGKVIMNEVTMPGENNHAFEYWRLQGWSRFGVGKNSRIRLELDPNDNPLQHYKQLMLQASEGNFTAGEIKQLMEAINVGLNSHQVFTMQKEIDQLKSDLVLMQENTDVHNSGTNQGTAQKDKDSVEDSVCEPIHSKE